MRPRTKLSVIIPAYNESATIAEVVRQVVAVPVSLDKELILVDDHSTDGTAAILEELAATYRSQNPPVEIQAFRHERNLGKGAGIHTGLRHATGEIILIQDADLELDPREYPKLLRPILAGEADVVFGNRFHNGAGHVRYRVHYWGNRFLTFLANLLSGLHLGDMGVGYKVFRRETLQGITLRSEGFGFDPEFTMKVARLGCRISEVPISYNGRTYNQGKKIKWKDGVRHIYTLFRYSLFD
jgi:glycosyltransferase involved in cell wall biosynthesis